jgi:hypothetical protein
MHLSQKHSLLLALGLGAYFGLAALLLNPFAFLASNIWLSSAMIAGISGLCVFLFARLLQRVDDPFRLRIWSLVGLFVSPLLAGLSVWALHPVSLQSTLLYLSSFVISDLLPLAVAVLWFVFDDLKTKIIISGKDETEPDLPVLKLTNEKGRVLLKVKLRDVICFEANDNYVITYYLLPEKGLAKTMERVALKRICEIVEEMNVDFQRVHKSFLINPNFVESVEGKSQAYRIRMAHLEKEIPVSRSYDVGRFEA